MTGLKDLFSSASHVFCIFLMLVSTVLVFTHNLSTDDWMTYTKWIMITIAASHAITNTNDTRLAIKLPVASLKDSKTDV